MEYRSRDSGLQERETKIGIGVIIKGKETIENQILNKIDGISVGGNLIEELEENEQLFR